jgi:uncharacterized membrane protein YadS
VRSGAALAAPLATACAVAIVADAVPGTPWPLAAVAAGLALGASGVGGPRRHEPALTLGFALVGLEADLAALTGLGGVVLVAPLVFWLVLALLGAAARACDLVGARSAGLVVLGLSGSGLPPLIAAAERDPRVTAAERSAAVLVVVLSGVAASSLLPPLGRLLGLSAGDLGLWLGVVVSQTTQARASAELVSPEAVAVVASTKLVLLVTQGLPLAAYLAFARARGGAAPDASPARALWPALVAALLPRHVLAFALAALAAALAPLPAELTDVGPRLVPVCFALLLVEAGRELGARPRSGSSVWGTVGGGVLAWLVAALVLAALLAARGVPGVPSSAHGPGAVRAGDEFAVLDATALGLREGDASARLHDPADRAEHAARRGVELHRELDGRTQPALGERAADGAPHRAVEQEGRQPAVDDADLVRVLRAGGEAQLHRAVGVVDRLDREVFVDRAPHVPWTSEGTRCVPKKRRKRRRTDSSATWRARSCGATQASAWLSSLTTSRAPGGACTTKRTSRCRCSGSSTPSRVRRAGIVCTSRSKGSGSTRRSGMPDSSQASRRAERARCPSPSTWPPSWSQRSSLRWCVMSARSPRASTTSAEAVRCPGTHVRSSASAWASQKARMRARSAACAASGGT